MSLHGIKIAEGINATSVLCAALGNNTVLAAPTAGRRIFYLCASALSTNAGAVLVTLKFGAAGTALYTVNLAPGQFWSRNIGAGGRCLESGIETLVAELSAAEDVYVSVEHESY